jgi:hypothetical protein
MYAAEIDQFQIIEDLISAFMDVEDKGKITRKARVNVNLLDEVILNS